MTPVRPSLVDLINGMRNDAVRVAAEAKSHTRTPRYSKGEFIDGIRERSMPLEVVEETGELMFVGTRAGHPWLAEESQEG